ncbi:hypothetical protein CLV84_0012 [Neolewinella xylanilytica]|uniref:Uncharacterized protein n=1 Tax=Neolewinella xylanilytica TaxID=1514080 RepID=A0A2S6I6I1_9BACT|nr:DUF5995 family protein [Neolewinella xylanilytica]PPK87079.1 hypothetical protein CLV84_0012 [Neolewinella xylanilytica]
MTAQPDILERMDRLIEEWQGKQDARHVFLGCYRLMTANMLEAIDAGDFHDRAWITRLLHHFGGYYFDALTCFDCGDPVPRVWEQVHVATARKELRTVQCLLLGVNAHINYDLVLTLYDLHKADWARLSPEQRRQRYEDHYRVNGVIADSIDRVQDELLAPGDPVMGWIDRACGRLDEYLIAGLISRWRDEVWDRAGSLLMRGDHTERERLRRELEEEVLERGRLLAWTP